MQKKDINPAGMVNFTDFPEKILLQGKKYPITIKLKNKSEIKEIPVDFYLKYRMNGFKILDLPENLKSEVWFSMPHDLEYVFTINIEPTIEGPLQFEINMFGKKVTYSQVEKVRQFEVEVEKESGTDTSDVQLVKEIREEKYLEEKIDTEEIPVDSKAIYMEAINAGQSTSLENFMTLGDVSSNIEQIKASTIIFYFPLISKPGYNELLRIISKKMFETTGNSFFYLNFPLSQKLNDAELKSIKDGMEKFLPRIQHLDSKLIFNLDFIPKLEKPTIILGEDDNGKAQEIYNVLMNEFGSKGYDIILDSNIFEGGKIFEHLQAFCRSVKADIINLVLSEHFSEDHSLFIDFLNVFLKK